MKPCGMALHVAGSHQFIRAHPDMGGHVVVVGLASGQRMMLQGRTSLSEGA
jgi:hypothetical protein